MLIGPAMEFAPQRSLLEAHLLRCSQLRAPHLQRLWRNRLRRSSISLLARFLPVQGLPRATRIFRQRLFVTRISRPMVAPRLAPVQVAMLTRPSGMTGE